MSECFSIVRRFRPAFHISAALILCLGGAVSLRAAENVPASGGQAGPAELFPFTLPWNDASPGLTNLSGWLEKPAGKFGFIVAKDGHLWAGDRRVRLMGVNLVFDACFPQHEDADQIATRMARFGINCVRLHLMDARIAPRGLLKDDWRTMDPAELDRLDYLVSKLKANGIYSNLGLHVARNFPGLPTVDGISCDNGLDNFVPQMIELQREYARDLLTHVNPYTGNRYADEPAVALVEISNEDGLIRKWIEGRLDALPQVYERELAGQWNDWLKARYADTAALRAAWNAAAQPLSNAELLSNADFANGPEGWTLEQHGGAQATAARATDGPAGGPALRVTVQQPGQQSWHLQLGQPRLKVEAGSAYTFSFQARSARAHAIAATVGQAHAPYNALASAQAALGKEWRAFHLFFVAAETDENARVLFSNLGQAGDACEFAAVSFRAGGIAGLRAGEDLGAVPTLPENEFDSRAPDAQRDWIRFLWDTEERYWTGMRRFIREELHCGALVIGTQTNYSPFAVQAAMDVMDWHAYWKSPYFPGRLWDPVNWIVNNAPMAGEPDGGMLRRGMLTRAAGKPFVCTEYSCPAPNTFSSETSVLLGAYAALHDLDGIFAFAYSQSADWNHGTFPNDFFDIAEHPTKMVVLPATAALFERGDVRTPDKPTVLPYTKEGCIEVLRKFSGQPSWTFLVLMAERLGADPAAVFKGPIALEHVPDAESAARAPKPATSPAGKPAAADPVTIETLCKRGLSATGELFWEPTLAAERGFVMVTAPRSKALIGAPDERAFALRDDVEVTPGKTRQGWSAITLTILDGEGFKAPARILVTATGYVQNTGMIWKDAKRDSVGKDWGHAPALVEGIPATIVLPLAEGTKARAWALDGRGRRGDEIPVRAAAGKATIAIGPEFKTLWYEIELAR